MALKADTYFRSLTVTKVARKEVVPLVAEICKANHTLTKLVIVDTESDSNSSYKHILPCSVHYPQCPLVQALGTLALL